MTITPDEQRIKDILQVNNELFESLKTCSFFGAHSNCFKINDLVFEVIENESDGYRSYLETVLLSENQSMTGFFKTPIAQVRFEKRYHAQCDTYCLVDVECGHVWLTFGTNFTDSYYPFFIFEYNPKILLQEELRAKNKL